MAAIRGLRGIASLVVLGGLSACGGSGGPEAVPETNYVTADRQGLSAAVNPAAPIPAPPEGLADSGTAADEARTGIIRAIEEADLYRLSGDLLYLLSAYRGLTVVDLARLELRGRLALPGVPLEMYLRDARALVLAADHQGDTVLLEIGLADPAEPVVSQRAALPGFYRTSRLIGDVLYTVTDQEVRSWLVATIPFSEGSSRALAGGAEFAHATDSLLFIAGGNADGGTAVTLLDVADEAGHIVQRGSVDFPGYLGDDQKLHFGGGVLRVVTHDRTDFGLSRLFTVDVSDPDNPAVLATLELARGEQLFATRFTEDRAYLVTFEIVDPLWVVDLGDPRRPFVAGELEVPGYSTQIVADGTQLVTIGVDPARDWTASVSLFDVSNPGAPLLLDREDVGDSSATALWERKALGVYPNLVLVPRWDGLAVIDRETTSLTLSGVIEVAGGTLRGFPYGSAIVALSAEEVVLADAMSLDATGRVVVADNVLDVGRLGDGTLIRLVQKGNRARLGEIEVDLWAEALYPYQQAAAIIGWDLDGRAAFVADFDRSPPVLSARLDLGSGGGIAISGVADTVAAADLAGGGAALIAPFFSSVPAAMTESGKLAIPGHPAGDSYSIGGGEITDGVIVVDIPKAALGKGVAVRGAAITGLVADGTALAMTTASHAGEDDEGRPLLRHEYRRIDLDAGTLGEALNVPGYVVAAAGEALYTIEDEWADDWSVTSTVVASRAGGNRIEVLDRLILPEGAYDLRAAGSTLFYTTGAGAIVPLFEAFADGELWLPQSDIGTVRLSSVLARGPVIALLDAYRSLLLPEDGAALITRDGLAVERWDFGGSAAELSWSADLPAYPLRAHSDPAMPQHYLLALGYGGELLLP